jgi:hypothetical protein
LLLYSSHLPLGVPNGLVIQLGTSYFLAPSTSNQGVKNGGGFRSETATVATFLLISGGDAELLLRSGEELARSGSS